MSETITDIVDRLRRWADIAATSTTEELCTDAADEIDRLREQAEKLRASEKDLARRLGEEILVGAQLRQYLADPKLVELELEPGGALRMGLEPGLGAKVLAASFADLIGSNPEAKNRLSVEVGPFPTPDQGELVVTVRRKDGKTPEEMVGELQAEVERLSSALDRVRVDWESQRAEIERLGQVVETARAASPPPPAAGDARACPFCGSAARIYEAGGHWHVVCDGRDCEATVCCSPDRDRVIGRWNRAAAPEPRRPAAIVVDGGPYPRWVRIGDTLVTVETECRDGEIDEVYLSIAPAAPAAPNPEQTPCVPGQDAS